MNRKLPSRAISVLNVTSSFLPTPSAPTANLRKLTTSGKKSTVDMNASKILTPPEPEHFDYRVAFDTKLARNALSRINKVQVSLDHNQCGVVQLEDDSDAKK